MPFSLGKLSLLLLLLCQISWSGGSRGRTTKRPAGVISGRPSPAMEKMIRDRFRALPKAQLIRSKTLAAKRLQSNLTPVFQALAQSNDKGMSPSLRASAKSISTALSQGQLTQSLVNSLPSVMTSNPGKTQPAQQLNSILQSVLPFATQNTLGPLDALGKFVRTNSNGVNNLLARVLGGVPDLLRGVVPALLAPLGAVTDTFGGTVDSVGTLLGSLLSG